MQTSTSALEDISPAIRDRQAAASGKMEDPYAEERCERQCHDVRMEIISTLYSAKGGQSLMTQKDINDFMNKGTTREVLKQGGYHTYEEQLGALKGMVGFAKNFAKETIELGTQFHAALRQAKEDKVLSPESIAKWEKLAKERDFDWSKVKEFFKREDEQGFKKWSKDWKDLGGMLKQIKEYKESLGVKDGDLEALTKLKEVQTKGKFKVRMKAAQEALDALVEFKHGTSSLYKSAKAQLDDAVHGKKCVGDRIAKNWLTYTFKQKKPSALRRFVEAQLPSLIHDWTDLRERYDNLRKQGKQLPPLESFTAMQWPSRKALIEKLEGRGGGAETKNPALAAVDRAVEACDWKRAKLLMQRVDRSTLSEDERMQLTGLERHIEANAMTDEEELLIQGQTPQQLQANVAGMHRAIDGCPELIKRLYGACLLEEDPESKLRCAMTGIYNMRWATENNYLNEKRLHQLRENAAGDTKRIEKYGHRRLGLENINARAGRDNEQVFRPFEKGHKGPEYVHYDRDSLTDLMKDIRQRSRIRDHNYWFLIDPLGVDLDKINEVSKEKHLAIKRGLASQRMLRALGGRMKVNAGMNPHSN